MNSIPLNIGSLGSRKLMITKQSIIEIIFLKRSIGNRFVLYLIPYYVEVYIYITLYFFLFKI